MADRKDELKDDELAVLKQKLDENALDDVINILKRMPKRWMQTKKSRIQ